VSLVCDLRPVMTKRIDRRVRSRTNKPNTRTQNVICVRASAAVCVRAPPASSAVSACAQPTHRARNITRMPQPPPPRARCRLPQSVASPHMMYTTELIVEAVQGVTRAQALPCGAARCCLRTKYHNEAGAGWSIGQLIGHGPPAQRLEPTRLPSLSSRYSTCNACNTGQYSYSSHSTGTCNSEVRT
jgi:hypothetical protein